MEKKKTGRTGLPPHAVIVNGIVFAASLLLLLFPSFLEEHALLAFIAMFSSVLAPAQLVRVRLTGSAKSAESPDRGDTVLAASAAGFSLLFGLVLLLLRPRLHPLYGRLALVYLLISLLSGLAAVYAWFQSGRKRTPSRKPAPARKAESARAGQGVTAQEAAELTRQYEAKKRGQAGEDRAHGKGKAKDPLAGAGLGPEQRALAAAALGTETLAEWNMSKGAFRPLLGAPGLECVAAHYGELRELDRKWAEMGLNRFRYGFGSEYPLDAARGKAYVDRLLSFGPHLRFYRDASGKARAEEVYDVQGLYKKLDRYIGLEGDGIYETAEFSFAAEFSKNDYECFADTGVLFTADANSTTPTCVLLTNEEFCDAVERNVLEWYAGYSGTAADPAGTKRELDALLRKLRDSMAGNVPDGLAEDAGQLRKCGEYYYLRNPDDTAAIVQYIGMDEVGRIPDALDGHPVTGIASHAFSCEETARLVVPESVRVIGEWMPLTPFSGCGITDGLILPAGITVKGRSFTGSELPKTVVIPERAVLEGDCFSRCGTVEVLFVGPRARLGGTAFRSCPDLRTVVCAPGSRVEGGAFGSCEHLEKLILCGDAEVELDGIEIVRAEAEEYARLLNNCAAPQGAQP